METGLQTCFVHLMKKIILISVAVLVLLAGAGVIIQTTEKQESEYKFPDATQTVKQYFNSWNSKDWPNMYSIVSDGFKKIEPTAQTLVDFKTYSESQNIQNVKLLDLKEESNDGKTALIGYKVEFTLKDGTKKEFSGKFTLKYREADVIKGWKLIHPYGEKIDTI